MKQTLAVNIEDSKEKEYKIDISDCSFEKLMARIDDLTSGQKRLFVVSKNVFKLYKNKLNLPKTEVFLLQDGEQEKNIKNYLKIVEKMSNIGLARNDILIAIGGGVVGDITGFVASTYMRGIDFIQVPTTLLAMVDSSVGGKTALDLKYAKNIIGSFYQPKAVLININFLTTLDDKQYKSGLGEIIKYAFIESNCNYSTNLFMFEFLTLGSQKIMEREPVTLIRMIEYSLKLKISVVNQDEKESGLRKVLNFGHTYAHALETISGYKKFTHGEAVVYGMYFVIKWAYEKGYITYSYYRLSVELLEKYGFKPLKHNYPQEKLIEIMKKDKKASNGKIAFIIPCNKKEVKEIKLAPPEVEEMFF